MHRAWRREARKLFDRRKRNTRFMQFWINAKKHVESKTGIYLYIFSIHILK